MSIQTYKLERKAGYAVILMVGVILLLCFITFRLHSADQLAPSPVVTTLDTGGGSEVTTSALIVEKELLTLRFTDEPLKNVIALFTKTLGLNILASSSDLENKLVTVNLTGVEWKTALCAILAMHDLLLVEQTPVSGVYVVIPRQAESSEQQMVVETIRLNYITTEEAMLVLKPLLSTNATLLKFASGNALVLRATPSNLAEIKNVLSELDAPVRQICVEAKFMELSDQASRQLGIDWQALEALTIRGTDAGVEYSKTLRRSSMDERGNIYLRRDNRATDMEFDVKAKNVKTVEVDRDGVITRTSVLPVERSQIRTAVLGIDDFRIVLSALNKLDGASMISNPKIIVASGATNAFFSIGSRLPIIKSTRTVRGVEQGITDVVLELDTALNTEYIKGGYLKTGIELRVIPTAKASNLIEARIQPKLIRELKRTQEQQDINLPWPSFAVKEIDTTFTLKDGQTVAIGGLTSTTDAERTSKIPLLGSIPLIGRLFSYKYSAKEQVETIIFVTLSLMPSESMGVVAGIPQNAELVHKQLIRSQVREGQLKAELDAIRDSVTPPSE